MSIAQGQHGPRAQRGPHLAVEPEVVGLTATRFAQQFDALPMDSQLPQQTSEERQVMGSRLRRGDEGIAGELEEFIRGAPSSQLAEVVTPARLRISRPGYLQEPVYRRVVGKIVR